MKSHLVILIVFIVVLIIVAAIIAFLIYKYSPPNTSNFEPVNPINYPFKTGDQIKISLVVNNKIPPNYTYSFYNLLPAINNTNCAVGYNAVVITSDINNPDCILTVAINDKDKTKFALKTQNYGYLFFGQINGDNILTFGGKDSPSTDDCWFTLLKDTRVNDGYVIVANDGTKINILNWQLNCYSGQITNNGSYITTFFGALDNFNPQLFSITNLSAPIQPISPVPGYNFETGDAIAISFTNTSGKLSYLHTACPDFNTSATFVAPPNGTDDANTHWIVTMSSDRRAFALSKGGQFLQTSISMSSADPYLVSVVVINLGPSTTSDYDKGDFTTWFQFNNNYLSSPLVNMSFFVNQNNNLGCVPGSFNYPIRGASLDSGSPVAIIRL